MRTGGGWNWLKAVLLASYGLKHRDAVKRRLTDQLFCVGRVSRKGIDYLHAECVFST